MHSQICTFRQNPFFYLLQLYRINGKRTNYGIALPDNRYFAIPLYDFCTWSKTNCGSKPQYIICGFCVNLYDFIWPRITDLNKQRFILRIYTLGNVQRCIILCLAGGDRGPPSQIRNDVLCRCFRYFARFPFTLANNSF